MCQLTLNAEDPSRRWQSESTVPVMYDHLWWVNSPDGLRIRDKPGLDGTKTGGLPYFASVSVLETDSTDVCIDGITSRWMRIKSGSIGGWVFGGYLSDRPPECGSFGERFIERPRAAKAPGAGSLAITPESIAGAWFFVYEDGVPVIQGGSGESSLSNFDPNTGDYGWVFDFNADGTCGHGREGSGCWESGTYTLEKNIAHARFELYPEGEWDENDGIPMVSNVDYRLMFVDSTHLQISEIGQDSWYLCAKSENAIIDSIRKMPIESFIKFVKSTGYDTKTFSSEDTLLMLAVQAENAAAVAWLVGTPWVTVNGRNIYGMTALHYAVKYDTTEAKMTIMRTLVHAGADVNAVDDFAQTPLDYTLYDHPRSFDNVAGRKFLASSGGKSSRKFWADFITGQDAN